MCCFLLQSVRKCGILIMYQRGVQRKVFDTEQKGMINMTVRDLYIHSDDKQEFILFADVNKTEIYFKGRLEDCPTELINRQIYQFRAIDFNITEIVLQ